MTSQDVQDGDLVLRIAYVDWDAPTGNGKTGDVVHFSNSDLALVLNPTNARAIARLHGDDGDAWRGRWITLYYDPEVMYQDRKNGPLPEPPPRREPPSRGVDEEEAPF
jgi:hypothetical protein